MPSRQGDPPRGSKEERRDVGEKGWRGWYLSRHLMAKLKQGDIVSKPDTTQGLLGPAVLVGGGGGGRGPRGA